MLKFKEFITEAAPKSGKGGRKTGRKGFAALPIAQWNALERELGRSKKGKDGRTGAGIQYITDRNGAVAAVMYGDAAQITYLDDWEDQHYSLDDYLAKDTQIAKTRKKLGVDAKAGANAKKIAGIGGGDIGGGFVKYTNKADWEAALKKLKVTDFEDEYSMTHAFSDEGDLKALWYTKENYGTINAKSTYEVSGDYKKADPSVK